MAAGERGIRCITYNECPQVPGALVYGSFLTAVAAGLLAQSLLALVILSYGR